MYPTATLTPHTSQELFLWRIFLLLLSIGMASACGVVDYSLHNVNLTSTTPHDPDIGVIYFHYADDAQPYVFHATHVKHGYALQATLDEDGKDSRTSFVASRDKEYKYFVGIQSHYAF